MLCGLWVVQGDLVTIGEIACCCDVMECSGAALLGKCDRLWIIEAPGQGDLSMMCLRAGPLNRVACKGYIEGEIERVIVERS
jgi:hypothetical protein